MNSWAALFTSLAGPVVKRALAALGIGVVSYVGVAAALNTLLDAVRTAWGGVTGDLATIMAMGGANTAMALIAGAMIARVSMMALKRLSFLS